MIPRFLLRDPLAVPEQVFNACPGVDLTPVSEAPAAAIRAGWAATLPGQAVPLLWEDHGRDIDPCNT